MATELALCYQRQRENIASCHDIFYQLVVSGKRDERLETAVAFPATPKMMDLPLIPTLGPFGSNQIVTALNAFYSKA